MSLRATLVLWIALVLLACLIIGSVLVYWHAVQKVDVEMRAAISVAEHTVHNALDDAEEVAAPLRQLHLLVTDLDGDRHLRGELLSAKGTLIARSTPLEADRPAPLWFYSLLAPEPHSVRIPVSSAAGLVGTVIIQTDSRNEISEVWGDVILTLTVLALFCLLIAALVCWTTGRALRPLKDLIAAFDHTGAGDYSLRLPERGPPEIQRVSSDFNRMVERLAEMQRRERQLEDQLVGVQEEERAELAQDLHDEVGPLLFAVSVDLAALTSNERVMAEPTLRERLLAMQDALTRIQRHVKTILVQLKPPSVTDLGLALSIERIVSFWRTRYPAVAFRVSVPEDSIDTPIASRIVRIIQESISNALRHGQPHRIDIDVIVDDNGETSVSIADDGAGLEGDPHSAGWGLRGIRHQVDALGGDLTIASGLAGRGVTISARFPVSEHLS
jgi:two-component system sensor histidine kinase UhpB